MAGDPQQTWRKLQQTLASSQQQARKGLGGNPRGFFGGAAALLLLAGGGVVVNNALFNGIFKLTGIGTRILLTLLSGWWSPRHQIHKNRWCTERDLPRRYIFLHHIQSSNLNPRKEPT